MKHTIAYTPAGVCASRMTIELEDRTITCVQVENGCDGNSAGLAALLKGMSVEEAVRRLEGIRCGSKPTSCPDQLAKALKDAPFKS
ncbi:hypothetical protein Barb6_02916 [Bacteroidales bacterium Barb6]|nr:hypothetical protein Barb6_02916 [Bacteroidales bacterium Barb6]